MISSSNWVSEPELEDPTFLYEYEMNFHLDYSLEHLNLHSFSAERNESYSSYQSFTLPQKDADERPGEHPKTSHNNWNSSSPSSHLICFANSVKPKNEILSCSGNLNSIPTLIPQGNSNYDPQNCSPNPTENCQGIKRASTFTRSPLHAQYHVLAERKRRDKLRQQFITLSALIPGLQKMDKASVLGDAIKYVKQMQERMKLLEQQAAKVTVESVVFVKRSQYYLDDYISSPNENNDNKCFGIPLPEIEARVSGKEVLIRIHCERNKGCPANILSEIERLNLTILKSSFLPFGNSSLDITVVSQMPIEYNMTVKELVSKLRQALLVQAGLT